MLQASDNTAEFAPIGSMLKRSDLIPESGVVQIGDNNLAKAVVFFF